MSEKPEFDEYASEYETMHRQSLGVFGQDIDRFAEYKIRYIKSVCGLNPESILEFGCGTGNNLRFLELYFPNAKVVACDISSESLELAKENSNNVEFFVSAAPARLDSYSESFDVIFVAGVFHHIPHEEHEVWLKKLRNTLSTGGRLVVFEHNPWNPLTRRVVDSCPFDENAELVYPNKFVELLRAVGFSYASLKFTLFFPWRIPLFEMAERLLSFVPLGGQYCIVAQK